MFRTQRNKRRKTVLEFQHGARSIITNYQEAYTQLIQCTKTEQSHYWFLQAQVVVSQIRELGENIYKYLKQEAQSVYESGFEISFNKINGVCDSETHLCDNCVINNYPVCGSDIEFGDGVGGDNIMQCKQYKTDTYKFLCINKERFNPINFGIDYHKDGYEGMACFHYTKGKWCFSLYNDDGKVDCSEIAKRYGGGGHKGAAGMILETEQFMKFMQNFCL